METKTIEIELAGTKRVLHLNLSTTSFLVPTLGDEGLVSVNFRDSGERTAEGHEIWTRQANPLADQTMETGPT